MAANQAFIRPVLPEREPPATLPLAAAVGAMVVLTVSLIASKLVLEALSGPRMAADRLRRAHGPDRLRPVGRLVLPHQPSMGAPEVSRPTSDSRRAGRTSGGDRSSGSPRIGTQMAMAAIVVGLDLPISNNTDGVTELQADRTYIISLVITAVIAAPVVEEMVFRGVVLRGLRSRMPVILAIVVQGVLFGAAHLDPVRGQRQPGAGDRPLRRRDRIRHRSRAPAPYRSDDRGARHLQRSRAGHRAHRRRRPAPGRRVARLTERSWPSSADRGQLSRSALEQIAVVDEADVADERGNGDAHAPGSPLTVGDVPRPLPTMRRRTPRRSRRGRPVGVSRVRWTLAVMAAAERSPPRASLTARSSAAGIDAATARWPGSRRVFRLDMARPSGSRTVGCPITSHAQVEIGGQTPYDRQLLEVLLPEHGDIGPDGDEQLRDDRRDAVEMPRPSRAFHGGGQLADR